jgi:hypothetical protein
MAEMAVMDPKHGDLKVIWDPARPAEVDAAREQFDKLMKTGNYLAYRVRTGGGKGEQIREFDASAEKLILAPALRGG